MTNLEIYENLVKRVTLSSLQGINGTVFVYGQTGSGKTYTMLGKDRM
jgi:centromeric protein E